MGGLKRATARALCLALVLAFAIPLLQPGKALAAGSIVLSPTSGPAGQLVTVTGTGYGAGETVTIKFNGVPVITTPPTVTTSGAGTFSATFNAPAVAPGFYTVSATGNTSTISASAAFQLLATPTTTMSLTKAVRVNAGPQSTSAGANPGDILTYALQYTNTGPNPASGVTIIDQLAPGQTVYPPTTSPGCVASISGSITSVTCTVSGVVPNTGPSSTGVFFIATTVNPAFTGTITNGAFIFGSNVVLTGSNTTTVTVPTGPPPGGTVTLTKTVSVNGGAAGTTGTAGPGSALTYNLTFTNGSGVTASSVLISDVLAAGQTITGASATCIYTTPTRTVTCGPYSIPSGSSITVQIGTAVNGGFLGQIVNQASATYNASSVVSNTTTINPGTSFTGGTLILCGIVNGYSPPAGGSTGAVTISGVNISLASGASIGGSPIAPGTNMCVSFNFNGSNQANAVSGGANVPGVAMACGVYQPSVTPGTILVGGVPFTIALGSNITPFLSPGATYCFLLTGSGQVYGVLSGIPTHAFRIDTGWTKLGRSYWD